MIASQRKRSHAARAWRAEKRPPAMVREWCARFEDRCRERGIRVTAQRLAVYRILAAETAHPTAEAVYARLRPAMTWLSVATVYRILESLEREGFIRRVSTTGAVARFDANVSPHQHLVCRWCGRMTDFEEESLSQLGLPTTIPPEFIAEELDVRIVGVCAGCQGSRQSKKTNQQARAEALSPDSGGH